MPPITLDDIAAVLDVTPSGAGNRPEGSGAVVITGLGAIEHASPTELTYLSSDQFVKEFAHTRAAAAIVQKRVKLPGEPRLPVLLVDDAELAVAKVLQLFAPPVPRPPAGVDPAARVAASAVIGDGAAIGPFVYVGERSVVGPRTVLHPGVYVGDDVSLGEDCVLFPNVVVRERITLGHRVIIHAGSVLGSDGFGYRWDGTKHAKVPQIGTVTVGDDVEIGSNTCVDREKFSVTSIGRGTKIDNLVQVGHNVTVARHCVIVGQAGLAGSCKLGEGAVLGGQVAIRDHITVGDGAMVAATSGVIKDVPPKTIVSGTPALPHRQSLREQGALRRLPELDVQIRKLQEDVEALKKLLGTG